MKITVIAKLSMWSTVPKVTIAIAQTLRVRETLKADLRRRVTKALHP